MVLDESVMRRNHALRDMMGMVRAIISDGRISESEAKGIQAWIAANPDLSGLRAVDEIVGILTNVFDDGHLSEEEKTHLVEALERFGG